MDFGERIYELRSKNGMSQGELADKLDVSRQAVSKWENNSAVPDLDKLIKISELFSVSLDELVKGEKEETAASGIVSKEAVPVIIKQSMPMRKIAGLILFGMAFITAIVFFTMGGFLAMLCGIPFALCGLICYFCEKQVGLKCLWLLYYIVYIFLAFTTGRIFAYDALRTGELTPVSIMSLALIAVNIFMIVITAVKLRKEPVLNPENAKKKLILFWVTVALVSVAASVTNSLLYNMSVKIPESSNGASALSTVNYGLSVVCLLAAVTLFAAAVSFTVRFIKLKNNK